MGVDGRPKWAIYDTECLQSNEGAEVRAFEELWKLKVPLKFAVFAWRLLRDRLPTKVNLHRRQIEVMDRSCPFCRNMEEEAGNLFFHCSKIIPI